jgi:hypothetical protein
MDKPTRIPPTEANPEPLPPTGGSWRRDDDGGLTPLDKPTAEAAGLAWSDTEQPAEQPVEQTAEQPTKRNRSAS